MGPGGVQVEVLALGVPIPAAVDLEVHRTGSQKVSVQQSCSKLTIGTCTAVSTVVLSSCYQKNDIV